VILSGAAGEARRCSWALAARRRRCRTRNAPPTGKVFLAFGVAELPARELEALTAATVTDRDRFGGELEAIRERGFATIVDELESG
jgi:Bacterial transcriptional regulator